MIIITLLAKNKIQPLYKNAGNIPLHMQTYCGTYYFTCVLRFTGIPVIPCSPNIQWPYINWRKTLIYFQFECIGLNHYGLCHLKLQQSSVVAYYSRCDVKQLTDSLDDLLTVMVLVQSVTAMIRIDQLLR